MDTKMPPANGFLISLLGLCPRPRDLSHQLKARLGSASEAARWIGLRLASSSGSALELVAASSILQSGTVNLQPKRMPPYEVSR